MTNRRVMTRSKRRKANDRLIVSPARLISGGDNVITMPGKALINYVGTTTTVNFLLTPNVLDGVRLFNLQRCFQEFRFTEICLKLTQEISGATNFCVAYYKVPPETLPLTLTTVYNSEVSRFISSQETVPQMMILGPKELKGGIRTWYDCKDPQSFITDRAQGQFFVVSSAATGRLWLEIGYVVQFRGPTNQSAD